MKHCRICESEALGDPVVLTEMMFGTAAPFAYRSCADCGCLQIIDPPADMSAHYGPGYYSFDIPSPGLKGRLRDSLTLNGPAALFGKQPWFMRPNWRAVAEVSRKASIIDIGIGRADPILAQARLQRRWCRSFHRRTRDGRWARGGGQICDRRHHAQL